MAEKDWKARGMALAAVGVICAIGAIDPAKGALVAGAGVFIGAAVGCWLTRREVVWGVRQVWRRLR